MRSSTCRVATRSLIAFFVSASPLAIGTAYAQTETPGDTQAEETQPGSSASQPADSEDEVITVIAQRREEAAQDVPISLQFFSGENLSGLLVDNTDDLPNVIGGFLIAPAAARPSLFLRGVGTNSSNTSPVVLTFVDDIYYPFGQSTDFVNIASVTALKGPQGTLFGRQATAGVIQVRTRPPSETFGARLELGYGNYDTFSGSAYVTGGLADGVAMDLAVRYQNQGDGFGVNVFNGQDVFFTRRFTARSRIRFELSDVTNITIGGDYSRLRGTTGVNVSPAVGYGTLFVNGAIRQRGVFYPGSFDVNANLQPFWRSREWGVNATFETQFSDITLRSISSFRRSGEEINIDFDGGPANTTNLGFRRDPRSGFTQEVQLVSDSTGNFQWVVGLFYYRAHWHSDPFQLCTGGNNLDSPGCGPVAIAEDFTDSKAAYAQATYEFLPDTRLTLGGRYTNEKRRTEGFVLIANAEVPGRRGSLSQEFNVPTWRIALDHSFTPDVMAYVSASRGFNSGFHNQANFGGFANTTQNRRVLPEYLTVYEVGLKTELFDRRVRFNLSGFHYRYNNLQQQIYDLGAVVTINAGSAEITGVDFEIVVRPARSLTLSLTGAYLDTQYTSYPLAPNYVPQANGSLLAIGNIDAAGNRIVNAPEWSWTVSAVHVLPTSIGEFTTSAVLNYRGEIFVDPANRFELPTRYLANFSERWTSTNGRYFISIWAENLFNERYDYSINILTPVGLVGNGAPPRTYGISVGVEFGGAAGSR